MAKIIDTKPDKVEQMPGGKYLFYFTDGKDLDTLPMKAEYTVVSMPTYYGARGRVVRYRVVMRPGTSRAVEVVNERELTAEEIAHFKGLIGRQGGGEKE